MFIKVYKIIVTVNNVVSFTFLKLFLLNMMDALYLLCELSNYHPENVKRGIIRTVIYLRSSFFLQKYLTVETY